MATRVSAPTMNDMSGNSSQPPPSEDVPPTRSQTDDRNKNADDRDLTAEDRDQISAEHDRVSETRDERADARDRRADAREAMTRSVDQGAVSDRAGAWRDRRGAAGDRRHAADDREAASTDRLLSAHDRVASSIDDLTGAYRRDAGMLELTREVVRAQRTKERLVAAFVDVDGLKATNDTRGHAAGDRLLGRVVETIRSHLRAYDLIVRYGGDEFVCLLVDISMEGAAERFVLVNDELGTSQRASVSVGLAEVLERDSLDDLIARADAALRRQRELRSPPA
jgi:diguanylate cyclase (GGDEF)-like protein